MGRPKKKPEYVKFTPLKPVVPELSAHEVYARRFYTMFASHLFISDDGTRYTVNPTQETRRVVTALPGSVYKLNHTDRQTWFDRVTEHYGEGTPITVSVLLKPEHVDWWMSRTCNLDTPCRALAWITLWTPHTNPEDFYTVGIIRIGEKPTLSKPPLHLEDKGTLWSALGEVKRANPRSDTVRNHMGTVIRVLNERTSTATVQVVAQQTEWTRGTVPEPVVP